MSDKKRVEVMIDGIDFTVVGNDDEEYVKSLAKSIDEGIKKNLKRNPRLTKTEAILLLALNLKDNLETEKKKFRDYKKELEEADDKESLVKIEKLENELEDLRKFKKDSDEIIEKYKNAEKFSSDRFKEENAKLRETHKKLQSKLVEEKDYKKEINDLKNKLASQENLNFDRNKEIINLKGAIRNLKEEITKLEKGN